MDSFADFDLMFVFSQTELIMTSLCFYRKKERSKTKDKGIGQKLIKHRNGTVAPSVFNRGGGMPF